MVRRRRAKLEKEAETETTGVHVSRAGLIM